MIKASIDFTLAFGKYITKLQERVNEHFKTSLPNLVPDKIEFTNGAKYVRVITNTGAQRLVHSFIDKDTGDVLKAATWKAPAKKARGNVFSDLNGMEGCSVHGANYLK